MLVIILVLVILIFMFNLLQFIMFYNDIKVFLLRLFSKNRSYYVVKGSLKKK